MEAAEAHDIREAIAAATAGDVLALRRLLERRPTLSRSNGSHRPLIELAVREGQIDAVRVLLDGGADPDGTSFQGDTLIDMAGDRGHHAIVALLEDACARGPRVTPSGTHADHP